MKIETRTEARERMAPRTPRFKPGRTLPIGAQWIGADIPGRGQAAKRRLRQMEKGMLPRLCQNCGEVQIDKERTVPVCDGCLKTAWDAKPLDKEKPSHALLTP